MNALPAWCYAYFARVRKADACQTETTPARMRTNTGTGVVDQSVALLLVQVGRGEGLGRVQRLDAFVGYAHGRLEDDLLLGGVVWEGGKEVWMGGVGWFGGRFVAWCGVVMLFCWGVVEGVGWVCWDGSGWVGWTHDGRLEDDLLGCGLLWWCLVSGEGGTGKINDVYVVVVGRGVRFWVKRYGM